LCLATVLALLAALYQWRIRYLARQFEIRTETRVDERIRIARDLHDTLLQSFQGLLLKFHSITYDLLDRPAEAQKTLESAVEQARQAITEGREGTPRDLAPLLQDDVYRIAGEASRNAFLHAHAGRIETEIRYDERQLRLRIRDDRRAVNPKFLAAGGRSGHFGLSGMHERAKPLRGKLAVWSELDSGNRPANRLAS
jgi:signal transduction histidine kinase